jgi:hypothetical protein
VTFDDFAISIRNPDRRSVDREGDRQVASLQLTVDSGQ